MRTTVPHLNRPYRMRDVAAAAKVSTATVSRVLNGSALVDPTTARRVRDVMRAVSYVSNSTGLALKSGRSGIYGLILPKINNPFFADFVRCFENEVVSGGMEMLLALTDHADDLMERSVQRLLKRGVDGIVSMQPAAESVHYESILQNRVPLVTMNRYHVGPGVSDIAIKLDQSMTQAISMLRELGHVRIGFLGGRENDTGHSARTASFRAAMRANSLPVIEEATCSCGNTVDGGEAFTTKYLQHVWPVTAVLCANDLGAVGALRALHSKGLQAGKDLSVVGLDDTDLALYVSPQLTTIRVDREELARLYIKALHHHSGSPARRGRQHWLATSLVVRESTGPAPPRRR